MRLIAHILLATLIATPSEAAPRSYQMEPDSKNVSFVWHFGKDPVRGRMTVKGVELVIDFEHAANSQVDVIIDATSADAGFPFATQAMTGPKVLDAARFPEIRFVSTAVRPNGPGAIIDGEITVRGRTRPITVTAELYRRPGVAIGDLSRIAILLTAEINRSEFGATGWPDMVGDQVRLQYLANIRLAE